MSDPDDEFSFLAEQAAESGLGRARPRGERLKLELPDGRTLSALRYTPEGYGDADGPAVTFLHGAGLNAHTWDVTVLALGVPALAIDLPGHGDSSWRDDAAYVGRVLAPDVISGLEAWTDRPQLLVGHSLGGLTGAAVAAARPDLIAELVVIDITPGIDLNGGAAQLQQFFAGPTDWSSRDELVERAMAFGLGGTLRATQRGVYFNSRIRPDGRVEWKHHFAHLAAAAAANAGTAGGSVTAVDAPSDADASSGAGASGADVSGGAPQADALAALLGDSGWQDLAAVAAPLTLIRGERGYLTDADVADFETRVPDANVQTLPTGHNVQEEQPVQLADRLRPLLAQP